MKKISLAICGLAFVLMGCEKKEDDQIYSAQMCLNTATPGDVDNCVAKVAGINSTQAYMIRCSADFIRANITTDTIINALDQLDENPDPTANATVTLFKFFTFTSTATADTAVANCQATGSSGLYNLAMAAKTATVINSFVPGGTELQDWIDNLDASDINALDPAVLEVLGDTVVEMAPSVCGPTGQFEDTKVCTDLMNAIADNGADGVVELAKKLLAELQNH